MPTIPLRLHRAYEPAMCLLCNVTEYLLTYALVTDHSWLLNFLCC